MRAETAAGLRMVDGSLQRRRKLACDNIRLAYYLAHRYKGVIAEEDAISIALEALWIAALHYDPARKTPFSTYAGVIIANALRTAIRRSTVQREIPCLHELVDPEDPFCSEERIHSIQDPASEDWEARRADRIDCLRAMKRLCREGGAMVFLRDVCGFNIHEASRMIGVRPHVGGQKRREALALLKEEYA